MDIRQVLLARTIQFFRIIGSSGYLPEIVQKTKNRYEFVVAPRNEDILPQSPKAPDQPKPTDQPKGVEFKHGRLKNTEGRAVIIQQFSMFADGIVVDTTTSTEDSDLFVSDFVSWVQIEFSLELKLGRKLYISQLEIQAAAPLEIYSPTFKRVGKTVTELIHNYGLDVAPYQFSIVTLNFDQIGAVPPYPIPFQIERRINVPYKENMWFSQAPLRTKDHIKVLHELENRQ
jgi:hypothetical protein